MTERKKRSDTAINLTPLIDVVFLLLIFFMVSTSFTRETQIKLELPTADVEKMESKPESIEISVDREGRFFVNGNALANNQVETLKRALEPLVAENNSIPVIISADANAAYQSVVKALDATSQMGISNLQMATQKSQE
ncbi:MAG: biopolymer transporter ExbD [Gammaproteobacteria bacterium]|nr:biopolymer transporter ExbD [Gammaproteobacteria bacterium]MDH5629828.1 biopolymer transporter ExbD [Gammaproteobacteria bacterium]